MKINFTVWNTSITGGTRVILNVAEGLARKGHDVVITALGGNHSWFKCNHIKFNYVRPPHKAKVLLFLLYLYAKLKNQKVNYDYFLLSGIINRRTGLELDLIKPLAKSIPECDINIATYCFTAFAVHRSGKGIPIYYMQHYEALFFDDVYLRRMADETYLLPFHRIANSSWLKKTLKKKFGIECYGPVIPGVDTTVFYPRRVEKIDNVKVIMALGKSIKWKGLWDLFKALELVKKEISNVKLILYGSEPYLCNYSPIKCEYIVRPSDEELATLYSMADVVVVPSWYESSPLPPLEAMACGAPVVTTRYGTEDYCFHEYNSLVVSPKNPKEMAKAIIRVLRDENLTEQLRKNGLETARKLTWDKTVDAMESILIEIYKTSI